MPGVVDDPVFIALTPALITLGLFIFAAAIWPKPTAASRPLMLAIGAALMANYAWWRLSQTLPPAALTGEYAIALVFLFTESSGMIAAALSNFFLVRTRNRSADADANATWLERQARYLFSPGICWSGLILNLCGSEVQALQINSYGVRPLRVLSRLAKL